MAIFYYFLVGGKGAVPGARVSRVQVRDRKCDSPTIRAPLPPPLVEANCKNKRRDAKTNPAIYRHYVILKVPELWLAEP